MHFTLVADEEKLWTLISWISLVKHTHALPCPHRSTLFLSLCAEVPGGLGPADHDGGGGVTGPPGGLPHSLKGLYLLPRERVWPQHPAEHSQGDPGPRSSAGCPQQNPEPRPGERPLPLPRGQCVVFHLIVFI